MAVGLAAGSIGAIARLTGSKYLFSAATVGGGAILGGMAGGTRGLISKWLNPVFEKLKAEDTAKVKEVREKLSRKFFKQDVLKDVVIQEIRNGLLERAKRGSSGEPEVVRANIREFLEGDQFSPMLEDEKEATVRGLYVLSEVSKKNTEMLGAITEEKNKQKVGKIIRGIGVGSVIGGAVSYASTLSESKIVPGIVRRSGTRIIPNSLPWCSLCQTSKRKSLPSSPTSSVFQIQRSPRMPVL